MRLKEISTQTPEVFLRETDGYRHVWLEPRDIVLAKTSYSTGTMCQWHGPRAVPNQNAVMLRAEDGLDQRYLFHWLKFQVSAYLSAQLADPDFYPYIREADLLAWKLPVPELTVQRDVVRYFDGVSDFSDRLQAQQRAIANDWSAALSAALHAVMSPSADKS